MLQAETRHRRSARWTLGLTAFCVTLGTVAAAILLLAHVTVQQLANASLEHFRVWSLMGDKIPHLVQQSEQKEPLQLTDVYRREYLELLVIEKDRRSEVDRLVEVLKSPLMARVAFIEASDIELFKRTDIDLQTRQFAAGLADKAGANFSSPEFLSRYRELVTAKANGELLYPMLRRTFLASNLLTRATIPLLVVLILIAVCVLAGIALIWKLALAPAMASSEHNALALARQNTLLRQAEEQIASAQRAARLSYWVKEGDGSLATRNMPEVFGLASGGLPASLTDLAALSPAEERPAIQQAYRALENEDGVIELSRTIATPQGQRLTIRERVESRTRDGGRYLMGTMLDISELSRANEELSRLEQVKVIDAVISRVAHDFNNILSVIQGSAELARLRPAANLQYLDSILVAVRSAGSVLQQLRTQHSSKRREPTLLYPLASVQSVVDAMHLSQVTSDYAMVLHHDWLGSKPERATESDEPAILVDRGLFENALLNLLKNACEAMPQGGQIGINMMVMSGAEIVRRRNVSSLRDRPGDFLCIDVSDNGPGMPESVRLRASAPFVSTKGNGRGLGLWSVQAFVRESGGEINIESQPGHGTSVQMYFPVAFIEVAGHVRRAYVKTVPPQRTRILLVEDEPALMDVLASQLATLGYDVVRAANADDAESALRADAGLSAALVDVNLGAGRTGIDLMRQLGEEFPQLKVMIMSGMASNRAQVQDKLAQGWRFLTKPFTINTLQKTLSQLALHGEEKVAD